MTNLGDIIDDAVTILRDGVQIVLLRGRLLLEKGRLYDETAERVSTLREAVESLQRAQDAQQQTIKQLNLTIERMREEYVALEQQKVAALEQATRTERLAVFRRLEGVLTQLPTLRAAADDTAQLTAADVFNVLAPLDEALADLGFEVIGEAGATVSYDPSRHQAVGRGARSVAANDPVRIRYVGYTHNGEVVCKAEVTRVQMATESASR